MVLLMGVHDDGSVAVMSILGRPPGPRSSEAPRRPDGTRPDDFAEEARRVGRNVGEVPECAGAKIGDIGQVRKEFSFHGPTYMLAAVPRTVRSDLRVAVAVVPGSATTGQDA